MSGNLNNVAYHLWLYKAGLENLLQQFNADFANMLLSDVCSYSECYMVETKATKEEKKELQHVIDELTLLTTKTSG